MFEKQELIVCLDIDMLKKVSGILDSCKIKYEYNVFSHNNQWGSIGSRRGMFGNLFAKKDTQYIVYVSKVDFELARKFLNERL